MKIRIGNGIVLQWSITTNGGEEFLDKDRLSIDLIDQLENAKEIEDFSVSGNIITIFIPGNKQESIGTYSLTLWQDKGLATQAVIDKQAAFTLVARSENVIEGEQAGNIDVDVTIPMSSILKVNAGTGGTAMDGKSAYELAVENGYVGTVKEWLESLKGKPGDDGKSAYMLAVDNGYKGTASEWLQSLKGEDGGEGDSAFTIAVKNGFKGTIEEWLKSLNGTPGDDGLSAYEIAVKNGFSGSQQAWLESLKGEPGNTGKSAYWYYLETTTDAVPLTEEEFSKGIGLSMSGMYQFLKGL